MNKTEVVYKGSEGKGIEKLAISLGVPKFNYLSLKSYCSAAGMFGFEITLEGIKLLLYTFGGFFHLKTLIMFVIMQLPPL